VDYLLRRRVISTANALTCRSPGTYATRRTWRTWRARARCGGQASRAVRMVVLTCSVPFLPDPTDTLDCRFQEKGHREDNRAGDEDQIEMPEPVTQHHLARADQEKDDPRQPPSSYPLRSAGSEHGATVIATAADCQDANSVGRNPLMTARSQRSALAAYAQPGLPSG
jgi:hypothetical protein